MNFAEPTRSGPAHTGSSRWMQASGVAVFVAVLVLLSFVLPPLFDTSASASGGGGGHMPPVAGQPSPGAGGSDGAPTDTRGPRGAPGPHTPPAGGHGPPSGGAR
ncbi:MAG: hypothetical protein ACRD0Q_03745 [Acidimicrobiales bacterium]